METIGQEVPKFMEVEREFVVLLDTGGVIVSSNQHWINYCNLRQLPDALWKAGEHYLDCMKWLNKFNQLQPIHQVLSEANEEEIQFSLFHNPKNTDFLSVKHRRVRFQQGSTGIILSKQLITNQTAGKSVDAESVFESMTGALLLLDDQLKFSFLNSESEKLLARTREELIGHNIWNCFPEAIDTQFYFNYCYAMQDRITLHFEEYFAPLESWFRVKVAPLNNGGLAVHYQKIETEENDAFLELSSKDYLTGLPTRRKMEREIEQVLQKESPFSLIYINLDNFKHINTVYNHQTGDEVIKNTVKKLNQVIHPLDLAGRLDGDELLILHLHQATESVEEYVNRVKEVFTQPIFFTNSNSLTIDASIGIASYPEDSYSTEELIIFAEAAMREAKKQRGPSLSFFHSSLAANLSRRLTIEKGLAGDLNALGFHFVVQPQINCTTGDLAGVEILARWNHPSLGPISPLEFIGIAEETGTISRLTMCLLKNVFSFINDNRERYERFPRTAINMTPSLLSSKPFFDDMFILMERYHISPEWIEIEVTESIELTYSETTLTNLFACKAKGISIALDDFGTGFSMLGYLMDYPINKIKLDKSFISKYRQDNKSKAILKSLIQFVHGIECELIAEGVETLEESVFLQENGCPIHQGYFHEKPLLPETFIWKYLKASSEEEK